LLAFPISLLTTLNVICLFPKARLKFKAYQIYEKQETNNMIYRGKLVIVHKIESFYLDKKGV